MTTEADIRRELSGAAGLIGQALDEGQIAQLARHLDLIAEWNRRAHLTSIIEPAKAARVHVVDSLLCLRAGLPPHAAVIDIGSGAGFPGIPLKIARPDLVVTLLETATRKAAFLELAAAEVHIAISVVEMRAERAGQDPTWRERFDVAVARAVASLPVLCELVLPFIRVGGKAVLLKGPSVADEVAGGSHAAEFLGGKHLQVAPVQLPGGARRAIVTIEKTALTPASYPRRPGVPSRRPLG